MPLWAEIALWACCPVSSCHTVMAVNAYAATTCAGERGQHVITTPYATVRHPYTATILGYLFVPLAFGCGMAVPCVLLIGLFIWRTANEDRSPRAETADYADYAQRTRHRLLPGVVASKRTRRTVAACLCLTTSTGEVGGQRNSGH
jgi:protein-S-isoprenylcysteine O-methyltransferase Ste14